MPTGCNSSATHSSSNLSLLQEGNLYLVIQRSTRSWCGLSSLQPNTYTVTESQRSRKCGLAMTPTCVPAKPCVSSLLIHLAQAAHMVSLQKRSIPTHPIHTHARSTRSSPQTQWCHCGRWSLGDSNVLGEESHPGFQIDHSDLGPGRLVWPAITKTHKTYFMSAQVYSAKHRQRTWSASARDSAVSRLSQLQAPCSPQRSGSTSPAPDMSGLASTPSPARNCQVAARNTTTVGRIEKIMR